MAVGNLRSAPVSYKEVAAGDPSLDSRAFRQCLGQYATGVTVITTAVDGELAGVTANSFASVSLSPPLILWSIGRSSRSFPAFERSPVFAVNVLSAGQIDLSK
jgi:flavin reductase (DIM6/NTAB) family NADH-FMN oxidoreductase RutF